MEDEPDFLIEFLTYTLFAPAHKLGFDPTVKRCQIIRSPDASPHIAYEYKLGKTRYITEGLPISEDAAYDITSRATRVWLIRKIIPSTEGDEEELSDERFVLKDVWLYSDAMLESSIKGKIFEGLKEVDEAQGTNHATKAEPYFMTFIHDEKVKVADEHDGTPWFMAVEYQDREHYFAPVAKASQGFDNFSATLRRTKVRKSSKFFTFNFYHDDLLNPAGMIIRIRDAYQVIESTTPVIDTDGAPRHWDANLFTEVPYRQVEKIVNDTLDIIEGDFKDHGDIPVLDLALVRPETNEFASLRTHKQKRT
ncbi:hypothetical protein DXG03_001077 [Asterophora parasitica]|uniref:Fungal-type protein kinase domain-containing protein n=1 Tax=Asterophora parasitica TaxID=117018 RepID=A0A9P7GHC5_9AGAR|nr:hypothetical protein DXG03_001077 [Asterophora parasitica]